MAEALEPMLAERTLVASEALLERERGVLADVLKIRFYPFAVASGSGSRLFDADGNEYLDLTASAGVAQTGYGHPRVRAGHRRRARPAADGDALLPPARARSRAGGAAVRARSRRLPEEGVVRDHGLGRERLLRSAPAHGDRPAPSHLLRRRLPRHDDRLGHALRPPGAGVGDRRRQRDEGALSGSVPLRLRAM